MTLSSTPDRLPDETSLGRSALTVSDLAEQTAFYRDVVGLAVLERSPTTSVLGAGETPLLVLERDDDVPVRPETSAGLYHNAFRVPSRPALGAALERIRSHWQLDGAADHLVSEALYLTDPEGNGVELYRDFPREDWPRSEAGRVQMGTDPLDLSQLAADSTGAETVPAATDLGHVHLEVTSLSAFEAFYVETLGFETQMTASNVAFISAGGYHHHLGANTWNRRTTARAGRGLAWIELCLPDKKALEAVTQRLEDGGYTVDERETAGVVIDPDGIDVRLRVE
ncbi:VOC family protein [Natronolimnobius baerhuensis]|uniref:Glyoxalase n=1 Tax=Natronolimnobius baerhuensis TaxID=253108 RepID=A0A202E4F0_9EURY|nr:VOC family protein [Natronolimnobius baerhuensis]OVE83109.1 glyoxalase [Natronolimnobius baerhuensis]